MVPTEKQIAEAFEGAFPLCPLNGRERAFLAFISIARSSGVGYGWMRQAVGLAWKVEDPVGYIDDQRLVDNALRRVQASWRGGS